MKKRSHFSVSVVSSILIAAGTLLVSCEEANPDDDRLVAAFTVSGTTYEMTGGFTNHDEFTEMPVGGYGDSGTRLNIAAVSTSVTAMYDAGPYIWFSLDDAGEGTYTETEIAFAGLMLTDGTDYTIRSGDTFTVVVTAVADEVGGRIEGSFSGTLGGTGGITIENGSFAVERIADGETNSPGTWR